MLSFRASSCSTCSKASFILSKGHAVPFTSTLKCFEILPSLHFFRATKPCFIILCVQSVSLQHVTCSMYFLAGDSSCHWPCIPACCSYSACSRKTCLLYLFLGENIPTILARVVLFPSSSKDFHGAPFAPRTVSTANLSVVFLLFSSENRCNISGMNWSCMSPHLLLSPPTPTARS